MTTANDPRGAAVRWQRLEALYREIVAKPESERGAALLAACPDDADLRTEVQALLDEPESAAAFLSSPALEIAGGLASKTGPSLTGKCIGVFEVRDLIGIGGMGEVYRAHDTRLKRDVAIKILSSEFKDDADRVARFEREAHLLASLNHPNIGGVYGLEDAEGLKALVMELVEGEDLSDRISRGAIPIAEALPMARQIAEAIEAAHERGVIHRDLKPGNIKLRADGTVKVLDFGLAKAMALAGESAADPTKSPTLTARATKVGMILGTAAYMAPEQALGKAVDRRADIWSFGVVLYEMLTGQRAFKGADVPSTLAAVLSETPPFNALPPSAPPRVRRLLERCLDRDPRTRLRDIGEARIEIARSESEAADEASGSRRHLQGSRSIVLTGVLGAVAVGLAALVLRGEWFRTSPPESRFEMLLGPDLQFTGITAYVALTPDGRTVAFSATKGPGVGQQSVGAGDVYIRRLDQMTATPLGVSGNVRSFSPDGRWLAFSDKGRLNKIPIEGGTPTEITPCRTCDSDWGPNGVIVFGDSSHQPTEGIVRVSQTGGPTTAVTSLDRAAGHTHHIAPQLLPGGRTVLFTIQADGPKTQLAVAPLSGGPLRVIAEDARFGRYLGAGILVFQRGSSLLAAPFDEARLTLGEGVPVLNGVNLLWQNPNWAAANGTLAYRPQDYDDKTLLWVNRSGRAEATGIAPGRYHLPRLSPHGDRLSVVLARGEPNSDLSTFDLGSGRAQREITNVRFGEWTPDGTHLLAHRRGAVSEVISLKLDGSGATEPVIRGATVAGPSFLTQDGRTLVYHENSPTTGYDLMALDLITKTTRPLVRTPGLEAGARLHPGGRWMAYATNLHGRDDVFVTPFPEAGPRIPVTLDGGREPMWSRDGRELFYRQGNKMFAARMRPGPVVSFDPPKLLFDVAYYQDGGPGNTQYDVAPDGRFLMMKTPERETPYFSVIVNWTESLKKAVGGS